MNKAIAFALLPLLVLGGCGDKKTQSIKTSEGSMKVEESGNGDTAKITATGKDGKEAATITVGGANAWPAQTAPYAPAYPGATVTASFSGNSGEGDGGMVTFITSDSPEKVIDFYKTRAQAEGLGDNVSNLDINGAKMFGVADAASGRSLGVQTSIADGKTTGVVTYGSKK